MLVGANCWARSVTNRMTRGPDRFGSVKLRRAAPLSPGRSVCPKGFPGAVAFPGFHKGSYIVFQLIGCPKFSDHFAYASFYRAQVVDSLLVLKVALSGPRVESCVEWSWIPLPLRHEMWGSKRHQAWRQPRPVITEWGTGYLI